MIFPFFSAKSFLGLDVQPGVMRLVWLKKRYFRWEIEQMLSKPLPQSIFLDEKIIDWKGLQQAVTAWVVELGLMGMTVAISVPVSQVQERRMLLSGALTEAAIEAELRLHVQGEYLGRAETLRLDFNVLARTAHSVEVFFVTASEDYLMKWQACIEAAGLHVKTIDVETYARQRGADQVVNTLAPVIEDYWIAYGLALSHPITINLTNWRERRVAYEARQLKQMIIGSLMLAVVTSVTWHGMMAESVRRMQVTVGRMQEEMSQFSTLERQLQAAKKREADLLQLTNLLNRYQQTSSHLFRVLGSGITRNICFTEMRRVKNIITFSGYTRSIADLTYFLMQWGAADLFSEIKIENIHGKPEANYVNFRYQALEKQGPIANEFHSDGIENDAL